MSLFTRIASLFGASKSTECVTLQMIEEPKPAPAPSQFVKMLSEPFNVAADDAGRRAAYSWACDQVRALCPNSDAPSELNDELTRQWSTIRSGMMTGRGMVGTLVRIVMASSEIRGLLDTIGPEGLQITEVSGKKTLVKHPVIKEVHRVGQNGEWVLVMESGI